MFRKKRLLVVDDDYDTCKAVARVFMRTGRFEVMTETLPDKVIIDVRRFRPDLIILDIMMPGKDGTLVAEDLRNSRWLKNIPIVFLSALVSEEEQSTDDDLKAGSVNTYIAKPFNNERLINTVDHLLV